MRILIKFVAVCILLATPLISVRSAEAAWGGWEDLGGVILEQPNCVSWSANRIDCFARGTDAAMYHRWWNGSSWGGWENLGGVILEEPDCVSWGPNRIDCFARGTNRAMYHLWWNGSSWGGWENLGGIILEAPDCVSWGPNRIDCFARGTDAAMYHRWWNGSSWGGWENLGGVLLDAPECVSWGPNRIDCFARGTDRAMYHRWWNGTSWGGWENLGGVILDKPNCVSWGPNRIDCFARGTNRAMYHRWWNGSSWGGWENLGGIILEAPECVSWGATRIDCFARGTDAAMWHRWWNGSSWGGWESLGGVILEQPDCVSWGPNRIDCFARGTSRAMFHRWWSGGTTRNLTVSRHTTATLSNADVDSILADASNVLQTNDGAGDVSCAVTLARSGNVGTFSNTDGSLDTSAELQTVFGLAGNVKVVNDVNFCAGMFNSSYIGCGQTPGTSFITERFTANQEGILWAHEFGHNQGLPHRDTTTDNVMYFSIGTNRRKVNSSECDAFRGSSGMVAMAALAGPPETLPAGGAGAVRSAAEGAGEVALAQGEAMPATPLAGDPMGASGENAAAMPSSGESSADMPPEPIDGAPMAGEPAGEQPLPPVEEFVTQIYFDGLPLDQAARYGAEDVPALLDILQDPSQRLYHENAALTLGMIGSEEAVEPLIAYLQGEGEGQPATASENEGDARAAYKGKVGATMALGYLGNLTGSQQAVDYLIEESSSGEGALVAGETDQSLGKYALIALGFAATDEAEGYLRTLQGQQGALSADAPGSLADEIEQSLSIADEVTRWGLLGYYAGER